MSSKLIGILSVGAALAHTEVGAVRERARAEPRELRDGLRGEVGREHAAVAPRSVTPSCQSCHRAVVRGSCRSTSHRGPPGAVGWTSEQAHARGEPAPVHACGR